MKILLAVDGSPYTKKMLAYLTTHMDMFAGKGHEFTALAVQPVLPARARSLMSTQEVAAYYTEEAEKVLGPVATFLEQRALNVKRQAEIGLAGDVIATYAAEGKYELIIMGSRGNGALAGLVMGSVATRVLAKCDVPVLLVR